MKRMTTIATVLFLAVLAVLVTRVAAQDTNTQERSFLTFSGPVEMPGVTLPAGTYTFRLADTPSRNVVQVLSRDEKDVLGQWTFVQAERPEVSNDTVIMFKETREGATPAIQYWYYPGERIGKEFIYPKDQAQRIASRTGGSVLTDQGRVSGSVSSTDAQGNVTPWPKVESTEAAKSDASTLRDAPAPAQPSAAAGSLTGNRGVPPAPESTVAQAEPAPTPAPRAAQPARPVGTSGSEQSRANDSQPTRLPRTASPLPFAGLVGLMSLLAAFTARRALATRS